jgi:hypothetical protein
VLEIKLNLAEEEAPPDWVAELVDSGESSCCLLPVGWAAGLFGLFMRVRQAAGGWAGWQAAG